MTRLLKTNKIILHLLAVHMGYVTQNLIPIFIPIIRYRLSKYNYWSILFHEIKIHDYVSIKLLYLLLKPC